MEITTLSVASEEMFFAKGYEPMGKNSMGGSKVTEIVEVSPSEESAQYYSVNFENGDEIVVPFEKAVALWSLTAGEVRR